MASLRAKETLEREPPARHDEPADIARVVLWMFGALICFSGMAVAIRELSHTLNLFEIFAIRNFSGLVILSVAALLRPSLRPELAPRHLSLHVWRNVLHFVGQYAWALAITLLPLATVFALEFTMPAWMAVLAVLWLGERLTVSRLGTVVLGFLGVLIILRPGLDTFQPAALLVLGVAIVFAVTLTVTKKLTASVSTFTIVFWMNVIQLPLGLAGSHPAHYGTLNGRELAAAAGLAVVGAASHYCLSNAFRYGDAILVVPLDFLRIPLIALVGFALYGEPLDGVVFAGASLIVGGVLWNLISEARRVPAATRGGSPPASKAPA